ncbi:matrixin family metalloprotease [Sphingopyxis panaciterrae]
MERLLVPASLPESARMRIKSVIRDAALPDTSKGPISVCFQDGDNALAGRLIEAAREWEFPGTSVKFDFGNRDAPRRCLDAPGATIRISFNGQGTWSVVGLESRFASHATMNFDRGRNWSALNDREFRRIVQHEFGHALGLYHEHQHPAVKCAEEIDWVKAMALYRTAEYNQSEAVIRRNFEVLLTSYAAGAYDEKSIMLYDIPRRIFRRELFANGNKPSCYFEDRPYDISNGDREAIYKYYPADLGRVREQRLAAFENYRSLIASAGEADKALGVASAFYAFDDVRDAKPYVDYGQRLMKFESRK